MPKRKTKIERNNRKIRTFGHDSSSMTSERDMNSSVKKQNKPTITHQTLFLKKKQYRKPEDSSFLKQTYNSNPKPSKNCQSIREKMVQKLKAAQFRYLNEKMYTNMGADAKKYFEKDLNAYAAYHEGFKQQVSKWPLNPIDIIIHKIIKMPQKCVIADFGCGEAKLAKSTSHTVHCFDLVAVDERVKPCDMAHVPLKDSTVEVVVFCLSLMGTNIKDYILEAKRVLKTKGKLLIAEVESRFEDVNVFIKNMHAYGFINTSKDFSHNLFFFLDFVKQFDVSHSNLPDINLKPCLYKKR